MKEARASFSFSTRCLQNEGELIFANEQFPFCMRSKACQDNEVYLT